MLYMKIMVLGSGAWQGIPSPFCICKVCRAANENSTSKDNRTRPELLVETDAGSFLLEVSPDIRLQSSKYRLPLIKDFLVTHWHFDHMYGLLEFHLWIKNARKDIPNIYCSPKTKEQLEKEFQHIPKNIFIVKPFEP